MHLTRLIWIDGLPYPTVRFRRKTPPPQATITIIIIITITSGNFVRTRLQSETFSEIMATQQQTMQHLFRLRMDILIPLQSPYHIPSFFRT